MFKVNNKDTSVFTVKFEHVSHFFSVFLLLILSMYLLASMGENSVPSHRSAHQHKKQQQHWYFIGAFIQNARKSFPYFTTFPGGFRFFLMKYRWFTGDHVNN